MLAGPEKGDKQEEGWNGHMAAMARVSDGRGGEKGNMGHGG